MTAMPEEVAGAMEEGCELLDLHSPCALKRMRRERFPLCG